MKGATCPVGARPTLNVAYLHGGTIVSGLVGLVAGSCMLSGLSLVVSFALCCHSGEIGHRPDFGRAGRGR
jgi:hypothetical protein